MNYCERIGKYSGPHLKGHSLERTPLYEGHKFLTACTVNPCGHLPNKDKFLAEGVSLLEGD